jgi:3-oxoacyl-[acyl-carrier protein] reductase
MIGTRLTQPRELGSTIKAGDKDLVVGVSPQIIQTVKTVCPLRRVGTPEEAASAILFLASPLSNYITGEVLRVTGGISL